MKIKKELFTVLLPALTLAGLALAGLVAPDKDYSMTERRVLAQRPALTAKDLRSGKYMEKLETYSLDQFPLRDTFRAVKARAATVLFQQQDVHGYYEHNGYLSKLEYPLNTARLQQSLKKQQSLYDTFLKNTACKLYFSLIPDKNCFLAEQSGHPAIDYAAYTAAAREGVPYAEYIDLTGTLTLQSFYRTDQHWRQESILPVAERLLTALGKDESIIPPRYEYITVDAPFYGTYYYQAMLPAEPDTLVYLTDPMLQQCVVTSYNSGKAQPVPLYNLEKAAGRDGYEMFLNGSDAFITLENPLVQNGRELIIFRDSFASSLSPLLAQQYAKITLIDLRYLNTAYLPQLIEFNNQDVLFLYSSLLF